MIGGAGVRGYEAADYSCEASACEGQELGELKPPPPPPPPSYVALVSSKLVTVCEENQNLPK